jgi:hypothetical protein
MKLDIFLLSLLLVISCRDNDLAKWYHQAVVGDTLALQQRFYLDYGTSCMPVDWDVAKMTSIISNTAEIMSQILYSNQSFRACLGLPEFPPDFVQVGKKYTSINECGKCETPNSSLDLRYNVANVEEKTMDTPPLRRRIVWMKCAKNDTFTGEIAFTSMLKTRWKEQMSDVIVLCQEAADTLYIKDTLTGEKIMLPPFNECQWTVIILHELMHSLLWVDETEPNCHDLAVQGFIPAGSEAEGEFPYIIRRLGPFSELSPEERSVRWFVKIFGLDRPNAAHCIEDTVLFMSCEEYLHGLASGYYAGALNLPIAYRDRVQTWNEKLGKYLPSKCWEEWACEQINKLR